uniref:Uncharacterized protein n=1 Tax=Romanomermis culicivorax TaxID=13658 RepID=A0A915JT77_ROMCU
MAIVIWIPRRLKKLIKTISCNVHGVKNSTDGSMRGGYRGVTRVTQCGESVFGNRVASLGNRGSAVGAELAGGATPITGLVALTTGGCLNAVAGADIGAVGGSHMV